MNKLIFSRDAMMCMNLPEGAIEDTIYDGCSVFNKHLIIFEWNGKFYKTKYTSKRQGLMSPWLHKDEVECIEVVGKEVKTIVWEEVT